MLPPGFVATIAKHIHLYGEPLEYQPGQPAGAAAKTVRALVQRPGQSVLIGDATQETLVVWIAAGDLPERPVRFDRLKIGGESHAVEEAHEHRAGASIIAWEVRCAG